MSDAKRLEIARRAFWESFDSHEHEPISPEEYNRHIRRIAKALPPFTALTDDLAGMHLNPREESEAS